MKDSLDHYLLGGQVPEGDAAIVEVEDRLQKQ